MIFLPNLLNCIYFEAWSGQGLAQRFNTKPDKVQRTLKMIRTGSMPS